ncbi:MAG TPA: amidohydrolase [Flavobacteriaceae bacterium]|nr:amidohydrolase [Flavobacteriaceae bacterium]
MDKLTNLRISIVQAEIAWENPVENRERFSKKIAELPETDLIVLPEMFPTGFSMNAKNLAENPEGESLVWMQKTAKEKKSAITGSVIVVENGKFYNRLFFVFPNGKFEVYDKKHLFSYAEEHKTYSPGNKKIIVEHKGWKICPMICYDLRFPVWSRNAEGYDLLLYVANWPKPRTQAWDILLKARAVENISYVAGVNGIGTDGNGLPYSGHSAVYGPLGDQLSTLDFEKEFSDTLSLSKSNLIETRKKLAFLNDRDEFVLT